MRAAFTMRAAAFRSTFVSWPSHLLIQSCAMNLVPTSPTMPLVRLTVSQCTVFKPALAATSSVSLRRRRFCSSAFFMSLTFGSVVFCLSGICPRVERSLSCGHQLRCRLLRKSRKLPLNKLPSNKLFRACGEAGAYPVCWLCRMRNSNHFALHSFWRFACYYLSFFFFKVPLPSRPPTDPHPVS